MIKYAAHTVVRSSSDHKEIIPSPQEKYPLDYFYSDNGQPIEHFSFCRYQLNIGILPTSYTFLQEKELTEEEYLKQYGYEWETLALVTNSTTPYLRTHYDFKGQSIPSGRGEIVSYENPYTKLSTKERNERFPIVAYGVAAIFAWNLDYDNKAEDFLLPCDDETLTRAYYSFKFNEFLALHKYRKYAHLSNTEKENLFVKEYIKEEQENWSRSSVLESYPLLYQYTKSFVQGYINFIERRQNELNKELSATMPSTPSINYSNVMSQFDNLPDDRPKVFISYSWDSEDHKKWVRKLSDDLRSIYGIYTFLDQYNRGGMDLISFMNKGISLADRVLLVGTPIYREKSERYEGGGARYEDQLITIDIYHSIETAKFIPILRKGQFTTSFPRLIETRTGYDFCDDLVYNDKLEELAADILDKPLNAPPPVLSDISQAPLRPKAANAYANSNDIFIQKIKSFISNKNVIDYTELIENEGRIVHKVIVENAHYDLPLTPQIFQQFCQVHLKSINNLVSALPIVIRYAPDEFLSPYINVMVRICIKEFKSEEITCEGTQYVHFLSAMFLFHAFGTLCVKYCRYSILKELMQAVVPAPNPISLTSTYTLAYIAGSTHWDYPSLNNYMGANWLYPYSHLIYDRIYPHISNCFLNEDDFKSCYAAWEHLHSLMFHYYHCHYLDNDWFPLGEFICRRTEQIRGIENNYTRFFISASTLKNEWEPIKQGLFNGRYDDYQQEYNMADISYRQNVRH